MFKKFRMHKESQGLKTWYMHEGLIFTPAVIVVFEANHNKYCEEVKEAWKMTRKIDGLTSWLLVLTNNEYNYCSSESWSLHGEMVIKLWMSTGNDLYNGV